LRQATVGELALDQETKGGLLHGLLILSRSALNCLLDIGPMAASRQAGHARQAHHPNVPPLARVMTPAPEVWLRPLATE
jgi:hypothetical protein